MHDGHDEGNDNEHDDVNNDEERDDDGDDYDAKAATDARGEPFPDPLAGRLHRPEAHQAHKGRRSGVPLHQLWEGYVNYSWNH